MKKKKINYIKVLCLVLMIGAFIVAFSIDKSDIENNINTWRLYVGCVICIFICFITICAKKVIKK